MGRNNFVSAHEDGDESTTLGATFTSYPPVMLISQLRRDGGTQPRAGINWEYVDELKEAIVNGTELPAVDVMFDNTHFWLFDGFHRVEANIAAGNTSIAVNVKAGTIEQAQWSSFAANAKHGLRRTPEDRTRAIKAALRHTQSGTLSNRAIARHLGVSDKTVERYRQEMEASAEIPQIETRIVKRAGSTYTMSTANIGAAAPTGATRQPPTPLRPATEPPTNTVPIVLSMAGQTTQAAPAAQSEVTDADLEHLRASKDIATRLLRKGVLKPHHAELLIEILNGIIEGAK